MYFSLPINAFLKSLFLLQFSYQISINWSKIRKCLTLLFEYFLCVKFQTKIDMLLKDYAYRELKNNFFSKEHISYSKPGRRMHW